MVTVGEETGQLAATLRRVSQHADRELRQATARLVGAVEPALTLAVGLAVGGVAVAVFGTLYRMVELAGGPG
jgi:type IV pilus assembly protein PilC